MSEKNNSPETEVNENIQPEAEKADSVVGETLVSKKKRFNKSDIFVFGICLVLALLVWFYASNRPNASNATETTQTETNSAQPSGDQTDSDNIEKNTSDAN